MDVSLRRMHAVWRPSESRPDSQARRDNLTDGSGMAIRFGRLVGAPRVTSAADKEHSRLAVVADPDLGDAVRLHFVLLIGQVTPVAREDRRVSSRASASVAGRWTGTDDFVRVSAFPRLPVGCANRDRRGTYSSSNPSGHRRTTGWSASNKSPSSTMRLGNPRRCGSRGPAGLVGRPAPVSRRRHGRGSRRARCWRDRVWVCRV